MTRLSEEIGTAAPTDASPPDPSFSGPSGSVLGLGIETSCDETSVAVVRDGRTILSNAVHSQIEDHAPFRGIVPEIASRAHLEKINFIYELALREAGVSPSDLSYVAVTNRPGLVGSLMMGVLLARSLHLTNGLPLVPVDHVEAHLYAVRLNEDRVRRNGDRLGDRNGDGGVGGERELEYPFLGLLLSGGNSSIYLVHAPGKMELLADTQDDACGEAFDKVASLLDLPYPGGPPVERLAKEYHLSSEAPLFPKILKNRPDTEIGFSFSGIKTAVLRATLEKEAPARICHDFQETVFELVERNILRAVQRTGIRRVVASGGVLANGTLRARLDKIREREGIHLRYPENRGLCTDNAAMVAALGYDLFLAGERRGFDFGVSSKREY